MATNTAKLQTKTDARFERKWVVPVAAQHAILERILMHPAGFYEIFETRTIHNLYFDRPDLALLHAHLQGQSNRNKYRLRWYKNALKQTAQWECKAKESFLVKKEIHPCQVNLEMHFPNLSKLELPVLLTIDAASLKPVIGNSYLRQYFLSADGKFRLTWDRDLAFFYPSDLTYPKAQTSQMILELKYAAEDEKEASKIGNALPFRMQRFSKYVYGMQALSL